MAILGRQIDGIWHTGVHVFGREYYFGGGSALGGISAGQSGITNSTPREFQTMTGFGPTRTIRLGTTTKTRAEFEAYLRTITPNWTCGSYSLLSHNCNNFSDAVSQYLVGKRIPSYITSLPRDVASTPMGQQLLSHIHQQFGPVATSLFGDLSAPQPPSPAPAVAAPSTPVPAPAITAPPSPAPAPKSVQPAVLKSPLGQVTYPEHSAVPAAVQRLLNISHNQKSNSLSQADQNKLFKLFATLQSSNSSNGMEDTAALELLHRIVTQWHSRALFPSLYLLRLLMMNKQEGAATQIRAVVQYLTTGLPSTDTISDVLMTQVLQALCNGSKNQLLSGAEAQAVSLAVPRTASTAVPLRQAALALLHNISFGLVTSAGNGGSPTLLQTIMKAAATGLGEEQDSLCKQLRLTSLGLILAILSHNAHCVSEVRELGLQALARTAASSSKCKEEREAAGFLFIQASKYSVATKKM